MAIHEEMFKGNLDDFLPALNNYILNSSISAQIEENRRYQLGEVDVSIVAYERYSYLGRNRLCLSITTIQSEDNLVSTAICLGGSQAVFFKLNRFGEDSFLQVFKDFLKSYTSHTLS